MNKPDGLIADSLIDKEPGSKPRFFLHDEMKAWLKDNLKLTFIATKYGTGDVSLASKFNTGTFPLAYEILANLTIDGEPLCNVTTMVKLDTFNQAFATTANILETCMQKIIDLQVEVHNLKQQQATQSGTAKTESAFSIP